jgi:KDO2-lipid IV(A) lauroyltransferase
MYRALGASLLETIWLAAHPEAPASRFAFLDECSRARLAKAQSGQRGVVIATAHTGNWELAAAAMAELGPFTVVVKPMRVAWIDALVRSARRSRGIGLAPPEGVMAVARAALRRGEAVALVIDQVPSRARHAVVAPFLGGPVDADRAPAALAASMGAPLVVAVARRAGRTQLLEILAVLEPPPRRGRPHREHDERGGESPECSSAWISRATLAATAALDRWVRAHPRDWLWLHRRWKRAPSSARILLLRNGVRRKRLSAFHLVDDRSRDQNGPVGRPRSND